MIKKTILAATLLLATSTAAMAWTGWTTAAVNFREGPGASYYKLGSIGACVRVEISENQNNWYRVQWNGRWGWVAGRYVTNDRGYCSGGGNTYRRAAPTSGY